MPTTVTDLYLIGNAIDTFAPGHYARVYEATDRRDSQPCAFKIMRAEHLAADEQPKWEAMAFINEADLLVRMSTVPAVMRLYDCGYVRSSDDNIRMSWIESFGLDLDQFRKSIFRLPAQQWRPYLALEPLPRQHNLLYVMKPNAPGARWRLPTEEGIDLAYQFADVLRAAHRQNVVYLDHKLEHLYWDGSKLRIIDWNSSRLVENGPQVLAQRIADDLHNLCVGVLYPIFTGQSPMKGTLRPLPADQATVDSRYAEIKTLDFSPEPTLSARLQTLLQRGADRQVASIDQLASELSGIALEFGWNAPPSRASRSEARKHLRDGLARLRQGHDLIREARDLIREAMITDDIGDDQEAELRRLLTKINDMLNQRVIP
jgi:serine/threonine protein kinase